MKPRKKLEKDTDLTESEFKFFKDNYLSKIKRRKLKIQSLKTQKYLLENTDFRIKPQTEDEFIQREREVNNLEYSISHLDSIKRAEKLIKELRMINCKFKLLKKGKAFILANTYEIPHRRKKIHKTFHYMPNGLPLKNKKKEYKYRNKYEFSDYKLFDEGIFIQKFAYLKYWFISYKGKKYNFRIRYKRIDKKKKTLWIQMVKFEEKVKT